MPLRADRELAEFGSGRSRVSVVLATKRASLLLAADMPVQAVAACSGILRRLTSAPGQSADVTSEVLAIRGSAQAMLLEFESAIGDLTSAVTRARDLRDLDGAAEHAAQLASLQLIDMGDLRGAAQAIDEAERVMASRADGLDRGQIGSGAVAGPRRPAVRRPRAARLDLASPGTAGCRTGGLDTHGCGGACSV
jgi:hypothetical protein